MKVKPLVVKPVVDKLMTRKELATFLSVTPRTIDNMRLRGLPTLWVGSSPRFDSNAVKAYLAEKGKGS